MLTAVRRYYDSARAYAENMAQGQGTAIDAAKALQVETKKVRDEAVPTLERSIAKLRERLGARGVPLD